MVQPDRKVFLVQGNTKQKKETGVSPRLTNFVLLMYNQLTSAQRYHLFVEHQNRSTRKEKTQKEIAAEIGKHPSTVSREYKRNATARGGCNDTKAQAMAERRRSHGEPHNKTPRLLLWRIEQWITEEQWSPAQIVGTLTKEGTHSSRQTIYNHIHADRSGVLLANTRHRGKYNRKTPKDANLPGPPTFRTAPVSTTGPRRLAERGSATGR